uniref:Putative secreted protein n=1 Tax=Anopheles marajoara TaxID=58244 RepID=A0A2M4CCE1_9DIPT
MHTQHNGHPLLLSVLVGCCNGTGSEVEENQQQRHKWRQRCAASLRREMSARIARRKSHSLHPVSGVYFHFGCGHRT